MTHSCYHSAEEWLNWMVGGNARIATQPYGGLLGSGRRGLPIELPSKRGNQGETHWPRFMLLVRRCPAVALHD